jgi:hypothetical protein
MTRVVDAAIRLDAVDGSARRSPALESNHAAWHRAAGRWAELSAPGHHADTDLLMVAGEVRAATREICHDRAGWASPGLMASRVSLTGAGQALQETLATGLDLAYASRAVASVAPLQGRARAVAERYTAEVPNVGLIRPPVAPRDLHVNRMVRMPEALRPGLVASMDDVVRTSIDAVSATAWLDQPATDTARDPMALTRTRPRGVQERLPLDYSPGSPATPGYPGR